MRIIKGTEAIPVEHPVFCIFGQPGIGKSSLGYSAREPLLLDFDGGAHRAANRRDTAVIQTWADVDGIEEAIAPYYTIVIDTVGRCLDLMAEDIIRKNPKHGRDGGSLSLQGFGVLKARFRAWMTHLRASGKDVVLLAHHKEEKNGDNFVIRPEITGSSYNEITKIADFIGYFYMADKARILDFSPTDQWVGKNPGNWKPITVPPITKSQNFLAQLISDGRKALGAISEESAKIASLVDDWRACIDTLTTPETFNMTLTDILKIESPIVSAQAKRLMMDRSRTVGLVFDLPTKQFLYPKVELV